MPGCGRASCTTSRSACTRRGPTPGRLRDVLARGVSVGAPPDMYNQMGQNWSQPPWRPDALAEAGFIPYRDMLRTILRHAGGIRVDHVLGMFRLWWIPEGMPAYSGTFVTSRARGPDRDPGPGGAAGRCVGGRGGPRHGRATGSRSTCSRAGCWAPRIMWFERDYDQRPGRPAGAGERGARTASRRSRSTTCRRRPGYLAGEHVRIRAELGLLTRAAAEELAESAAQVAEWRAMCVERSLMAADGSDEDLIVALHGLVAASPSVLVGVALTDAVGDRRAQNQPGTDKEYPNWRVPLTDSAGRAVLIEELPGLPLLRRIVAAVRAFPSGCPAPSAGGSRHGRRRSRRARRRGADGPQASRA